MFCAGSLITWSKRTLTLLMFGLATKHTFALWECLWQEQWIMDHRTPTLGSSAKCTALVAILKHGIIRPFWFEDTNEGAVKCHLYCGAQVLEGTWGWRESVYAMVPTRWGNSTYSQHRWSGWTTDSLIGWSASVSNSSDLHSSLIWTRQIFISLGFLQVPRVVYKNRPHSIGELKSNHHLEMHASRKSVSRWQQLRSSVSKVCWQRNGGH